MMFKLLSKKGSGMFRIHVFAMLVIMSGALFIAQTSKASEKKPLIKLVQLSITAPAEGTIVHRGDAVTVTVSAWGSVAGIQRISCQGEGDSMQTINFNAYPPTTSTTQNFTYHIPYSASSGQTLTITVQLIDYVDGVFNQYRHVQVATVVTPTPTPTPTPSPTPEGYSIIELISPNRQDYGYFGCSVSGVPDLNGNGKGDVIIGAKYENNYAGRAYIFDGTNGHLLRTLVSPNSQSDGYFGAAVSGIGDVNGDGKGDVIVGAYYESLSGSPTGAGMAYVFSGATGALIHTLRSTHEIAEGYFGYVVSNVPDMSGDGIEDILVGTSYESVGVYFDAGRVYLFNGATGALIEELTSPNRNYLSNFATGISGVDDIGGDGRGDIIVGAQGEYVGGYWDAGRAYIFDGTSTEPLRSITSLHLESGHYGCSVSGIPDLNGDGYGDYIVGAKDESVERAYVYDGHTGALLYTLDEPAESYGSYATSVAGIPDVNGDGIGDILVSSPDSWSDGGSVFLYDGKTGKLIKHLESPHNDYFDRNFGGAISGMPDVNDFGDGDIIIGASQESPNDDLFAGRAYIIKIEPKPTAVRINNWNMYD